ncbi:MAG: hypothetical protein AB7N70_18275 [Dehalococcoidia bacterium]
MELHATGRLIIGPTTAPFSIGGCPFELYAGTFTVLSAACTATADTAPTSRADLIDAFRGQLTVPLRDSDPARQ